MANKSALNSVYFETLLSDELLLSIERRTATNRKISKAFTSIPPSSNQYGSSTHSPLQVCFRDFTHSNRGTLEIHRYDKSIEVLEWIGFTQTAASKIHREYVQRIDDSRSFFDVVLRHVDVTIKVGHSRNKPIRRIMDDIGITPELQTAIYDPWYTMIFDSETLDYWVKNTIRINYRSFEKVMQRLNSQAHLIQQWKLDRARQATSRCILEAFNAFKFDLTTFDVLPDPQDYNLPATFLTATTGPPRLQAGHTRYWMAKSPHEMETPLVDEHGNIDVGALLTVSGGDFNSLHDAWYWTKDKYIAELYRKYTAQRCKFSETWTICVDIPNTFLDSLNTQHLFFGDDWKDYIYFCKRERAVPPRLWRYQEADLLVGHVATKHPNTEKVFDHGSIRTQVTEQWVMRSKRGQNIEKILQDVIMCREVAVRMAKLMRGHIYIDVHAAIVTA